MALIKEDAREYLQDENDQDLWQSIDWRVVENEEALGGRDWKEARSVFDAWVTSELKKETEECREIRDWPDYLMESEKFRLRVKQAPHYRFFIFADEASVNSVVDCDKNNTRGVPGGYYITLVQTDLVEKEGEWDAEYDEDEEDEGDVRDVKDGEDPEYRKALLQNFRAWDLVVLYASVLNGDWHEGFEQTDNGVTEIIRL